MHGGFISVKSEPGKTIFHILIPYTSPDFLNNIELRGQP
jgi:nitrogen-specific signal transduction histidine kinase